MGYNKSLPSKDKLAKLIIDAIKDDKEKVVWIATMLESEISKLYELDCIEHQPDRAMLLAKHLKWIFRDGEEIDIEQIQNELESLSNKE